MILPALILLCIPWRGTVGSSDASGEWTDRGCPSTPYRSLDGSCNNVRRPLEGAAYTPFTPLVASPKLPKEDNVKRESLTRILELRSKGSPHVHATALVGLWSELLLRDLSLPLTTEEGLVNGATGYLDASNLYGLTEEEESILLTPTGKVNVHICPECRRGSGIGGLYTLLYKEHNRIASELVNLNKNWSPEHIYSETRKILIAEIQHITYSEYLPLVLSEKDWPENLLPRGFYHGYSSGHGGGTFLEAALSALQLLPTMVPSSLSSNRFANESGILETESFLAHSLMASLAPALEPNLNGRVANALQLIEYSQKHGLASYVDVVKECSQKKIGNFLEIDAIPEEYVKLLSSVYKKVEDIDLLVGGLLEPSVQGSLLGPTFSCLLSRQFSSLRKSDRFWYENDLPPATFSKDQLTEIRKISLSSLFCQNMPSIRNIQPKAFIQDDPFLNAVIPCDHHPELNLYPWKEEENRRNDDDISSLMTLDVIKEALQKAEEDIARRQRQEYLVYANRGGVDPKSPVGTAAAFTKPNKMALSLANNSLLFEYASQEIMTTLMSKQARRRRQLDGDNVISFDIPNKDLFSDLDITDLVHSRPVENECHEEEGPCDPRSPYRTFTGHCNNLDRPNLGKSLTTFARLLPSVYENGISSPRLSSVTGAPLPSPRLVSSMIHADISYLHSRYSLMVMQFAQFVDHDITFTPNHRGFFASIPDCRSCDSALTVHPECMPIPIPNGDPYYPQRNVSTGERMCIAFMRSLPGQQRLGSREQINQNSAYLDGSQVYGEHACLARELRGYGGRLNVTHHPTRGKDLLPISPNHPECKAPSGYCFIAGDGRASEQPGLTAIHTVYMREHNRLVEGLQQVNPHWSDEKLYQTARKINIALYQHVIYNEFLPRILGWNAINLYGLKLHSQGYYKGYSSTCNPNVVTEFATAAYRIGHSLLRPHIPRMSPLFTPVEPAILLRDAFFNPDIIYQPHIIDEIMRGLASTPMESLDQFITGEITNHLFEDRRIPHSGMDLPALNIQRGRDHGIPPYNEYRSLCNLKRAVTWEDLSREIPNEVIARLRLIYPTVNDIDLFPGGLSERPLQGGLVGPTFACIIGLQFRQLRKCDRFWYENDDPLVRFSEAQLAEIRKSTLSKLVCNNMDVTSDIQRSAFDLPSDFLNPRVNCRSLPEIDLNHWRETAQTGCQIAGRTVAVGESMIPTPCTSCICTPDGAQCASLRVTDCDRLLREAGREAVLEDEVCSSQCGEYLTRPSPSTVSLTTRRPRNRVSGFLPTALVPPPPARPQRRRPILRPFDVSPPFLG